MIYGLMLVCINHQIKAINWNNNFIETMKFNSAVYLAHEKCLHRWLGTKCGWLWQTECAQFNRYAETVIWLEVFEGNSLATFGIFHFSNKKINSSLLICQPHFRFGIPTAIALVLCFTRAHSTCCKKDNSISGTHWIPLQAIDMIYEHEHRNAYKVNDDEQQQQQQKTQTLKRQD